MKSQECPSSKAARCSAVLQRNAKCAGFEILSNDRVSCLWHRIGLLQFTASFLTGTDTIFEVLWHLNYLDFTVNICGKNTEI